MTDDEVALLLIHGLGATPGVWDPTAELLQDRWPGPIIVPSLPGHGRAAWTGDYTVPGLAAAVASEVSAIIPRATRGALVAGHSLGGAVGLELASGRYGLPVVGVLALGIKTTWTEGDVAGMAQVAERGVRWFPSREEAIARFLRQAGLDGVAGPAGPVDADHPAVVDAVVEGVGAEAGLGWRVAQDPSTFAQQPVEMTTLLQAAACPIWLGAGERDDMATEAELSAFTAEPHIARGRGHNVQVQDPTWVADRIGALAAAVDRAS